MCVCTAVSFQWRKLRSPFYLTKSNWRTVWQYGISISKILLLRKNDCHVELILQYTRSCEYSYEGYLHKYTYIMVLYGRGNVQRLVIYTAMKDIFLAVWTLISSRHQYALIANSTLIHEGWYWFYLRWRCSWRLLMETQQGSLAFPLQNAFRIAVDR